MIHSLPKGANATTQEQTPPAQSAELRQPATATIRKALATAGVVGIRMIGPPGSGKTELIIATVRNMIAPRRVAVIVINPASARDAERLAPLCGKVVHIDAAIPMASAVSRTVADLRLSDFDIVVIEAAGGLAPLQDLGQDTTVAVFGVSGGDDKAAEYSALLKSASVVIVNKIDLLHLVHFDLDVFRGDVRSINPTAEVFEVSSQTSSGIDAWTAWVERLRLGKRYKSETPTAREHPSDSFFG